MPRYDYECTSCGHKFELKQSFTSEPVADCPECRNESRRVINSVPVVFKGSGWYVNDYGKGGGTGAAESKEPEKDKKDKNKSSSKAKSDSKDSDSKKKAKTEN